MIEFFPLSFRREQQGARDFHKGAEGHARPLLRTEQRSPLLSDSRRNVARNAKGRFYPAIYDRAGRVYRQISRPLSPSIPAGSVL